MTLCILNSYIEAMFITRNDCFALLYMSLCFDRHNVINLLWWGKDKKKEISNTIKLVTNSLKLYLYIEYLLNKCVGEILYSIT